MIKNTLIYLLLLCTLSCKHKTEKSQNPNIIVILADDLGVGDVNCYNDKSQIKTPHLDALAENGIRFTDAHSNSSVCTPTRYGILTGRYAWRSRLKSGVLMGYDAHLIETSRLTIASMLKEKGYQTAAIGKWHLGMDFAKTTDNKVDYKAPISNGPNANGFDYFYGISASLDMPPYVFIENDRCTEVPTLSYSGSKFPDYKRKGDKGKSFKVENVSDVLLQKAKRYIQKANRKNKPFFLYYALPSPHKPVVPAKRFIGKSGLGPYGDYVVQTDDVIGHLSQQLKDLDIESNTLVIFASDNASYMYQYASGVHDHLSDATIQGYNVDNHKANLNYRGTKTDIYEGGHRVPFIVSWPGEINEGIDDHTICTTDILATIAEITNVDIESDAVEDSYSFLPLLNNIGAEYNRAPVVHHSAFGVFALRDGKWKAVFGNGSGGREKPRGNAWTKPYMLFDMEADVSERINVANEYPGILFDMEKKLEEIIESTSK
jgi:arylsulfatase A-like enzyme